MATADGLRRFHDGPERTNMIRNEIFGPMHVNQARKHCTPPKISHPIYSAVHVRHHHSHTHIRLLKALKQMTA